MKDLALESWGDVESLLGAAGSGPTELDAAVRRIGIERVVEIVVRELDARWESSSLDTDVCIRLELDHGATRSRRVLAVSGRGLGLLQDESILAVACVRLHVLDLLENLYGACEDRKLTSLEIDWLESGKDAVRALAEEDELKAFKEWERIGLAVASFLATCQTLPIDLDRAAMGYSSDKSICTPWLTRHYDEHFRRIRNQAVRMLEIGIGGYHRDDVGGDSLRTWQRYFRRGLIYGLDITEKPADFGPRVRALQGDQNDPEFLDELGRTAGPFDVIVDDGSHINEHVLTSFRYLFPHVRAGGFYVIEDLQTSYWPSYGGSKDGSSLTTIEMLKSIIDGLHNEVIPSNDKDLFSREYQNVGSVHIYSTMAIIEKTYGVERPIGPFLSVESESERVDRV